MISGSDTVINCSSSKFFLDDPPFSENRIKMFLLILKLEGGFRSLPWAQTSLNTLSIKLITMDAETYFADVKKVTSVYLLIMNIQEFELGKLLIKKTEQF